MSNHIRSSKQRIALLPLFAVFLFLLVSCSDKTTDSFQLSGMTMGTSYHITVVGTAVVPPSLSQKVDFRLKILNQQMSTYIEQSELSRFNRSPSGEWFSVSPELFDVLLLSTEVSWLTNGQFDITVGPLVNLWGFGPEQTERIPSKEDIDQLLPLIGFQHLEFNLEGNQISKKTDIQLDLSAIAKGYAVDVITKLLVSEGFEDFMVEIGGELYLSGLSPRGTPWRIAIEEPDNRQLNVHRAINVTGRAVATSGDYRNYIELDGKRYSHTIDPTTGKPIDHTLASVTVIHDDVASADALATAINVMGAAAGLKLAEQQGLAIYLISKSESGFDSQYSDAFKVYLD